MENTLVSYSQAELKDLFSEKLQLEFKMMVHDYEDLGMSSQVGLIKAKEVGMTLKLLTPSINWQPSTEWTVLSLNGLCELVSLLGDDYPLFRQVEVSYSEDDEMPLFMFY